MSKKCEIPVTWEMCGVICITADTLMDAIDQANNDNAVELPSGSYVDASFKVSFDDPDIIRTIYNKNQPDERNAHQTINELICTAKQFSHDSQMASNENFELEHDHR